MLRPLLYWSALIGLMPGSAQEDSFFDSSECKIAYYGKIYDGIFITLDSNRTAFCFDNHYREETPGDCIIGPPPSPTEMFSNSSSVSQLLDDDESVKLLSILRSIAPRRLCVTSVKIPYETFDITLVFIGYFSFKEVFGIQATAPYFFEFNLTVGGVLYDTVTINNTSPQNLKFINITGCRDSAGHYKAGDEISSVPEKCLRYICNDSGDLENVTCVSLERCQGNGSCVFDPICTVTGPTVIGISGEILTVTDRCEYILMEMERKAIRVTGKFGERRRNDVMFLESVTLRLGSDNITLGQGGTVLLNNLRLNANSTPQEVAGVMLSKAETGVTTTISFEDSLKMNIFFDVYTAQIQLTGEDPSDVARPYGLCDSTLAVDQYQLVDPENTCAEQYNDTADSNINCTQMAESCDVLNDAPFTTCHNNTDPTPYMIACKETLCTYPNMDGLYCQFLEAYARACTLRSDVLDSWWEEVGCSAPQALCQDMVCGDHEFCGEKGSGRTDCLCRSIYAAPYRSMDRLGNPTVCGKNSVSVTLVGCLLAEKGIDYSMLHLNDPSCRGQIDEVEKTATLSFNSSSFCGTVISTNNSHLIYTNTIVGQNSSSDTITRQNQVRIDFSCSYALPENRILSLKFRHQDIPSPPWNYTLTMNAYTDANMSQPLGADDEVNLDQKIWVKLDTEGLEDGFVALVTESCWATNQSSPISTPRYDLIADGCPTPSDDSVQMTRNGNGTSNSFSFDIFQFSGNFEYVYLHCQIHLCATENGNCVPTCSGDGRGRRSD